jgi:hypothetical protein
MGTYLLGRYIGRSLFIWAPVLILGIIVTILTIRFGSIAEKSAETKGAVETEI